MMISLVIPAYNVEKYLQKCLESCLDQSLDKELEIIVVNDGSKDGSLQIAQEFSRRDARIKVISQDNQGLSAARNVGLKAASGDYIWFIDSDDWIAGNCLQGIYDMLKRTTPDIMQLQHKFVYEDGSETQCPGTIVKGVKSGPQVLLEGGLPAPAQFCVFRREFLISNNLEFQPGIYHEDLEFKPRATFLAQKVTSYNDVVYNYLQRVKGSITSTFRIKNALDIITVNNNLYEFSELNVKDVKVKKCFYRAISRNFNTLLMGMRQLNHEDTEAVVKRMKQMKHLFPLMVKSNNLKYMCEGILLTINVRLGIRTHKFIR